MESSGKNSKHLHLELGLTQMLEASIVALAIDGTINIRLNVFSPLGKKDM